MSAAHTAAAARRRAACISLALLALQIYVRRFPPTATAIPEAGSPEARLVGAVAHHLRLARAVRAGPGALVLLVVALWLRELWHARRPDRSEPLPRTDERRHFTVAARPGRRCLLAAFFAFPIVHTRWGDAYILAKSLAWPDAALRLTHSWQAPLDVWLHSRVWLLVHALCKAGTTPCRVYRLLSPLAGAVYLAAFCCSAVACAALCPRRRRGSPSACWQAWA